MSEPTEIDGFPVPPGCPKRVLQMLKMERVPVEIIEAEDLYAIQSIGYRAWMDEAERLKTLLAQMYDGTDDFYGRQRVNADAWACAIANAETCRTWTPTSTKSS